MFQKPAVVIDIGGHTLKAGFACDNYPVVKFRNVLGRPKGLKGLYGRHEYEVYNGDYAVAKGEDLELSSPVINSQIVRWDNMERILYYTLYMELKVAPEDRAIMLVCPSIMPMKDKIKYCSVFFEALNCPALCIQPSGVVSLYGSGVTTGVTVDMGYDTFDINPVLDGHLLKYAHMKTGFAGRQMAEYIQNSLAERDIDFGYKTPCVMDQIIQNCVYVTANSAMSRKGYERYATSPDDFQGPSLIDVSNESFMAGETMFQPDLAFGYKTPYRSLTDAVVTSIMKCDLDLRAELIDGIAMAGGLSLIPGVAERLKATMCEQLTRTPNILTSTESDVVAWMGGAVFAGLYGVERMWLTKKQYEDGGERIIRNRFL